MSKVLPLQIVGAQENNLQSINLDLDHDQLVSMTGLSGSGKSSLAFSTIYAEGQRRYIETFSPYTRQFFDKIKKPEVTSISHIRPAIAIQQRTRVTSSRSTVGSMTNMHDLLKILFANLAKPYSPKTGQELRSWTPALVLAEIMAFQKDHRASATLICATVPFPTTRKKQSQEIERYLLLGYSRFFDPVSKQILRLEDDAPTTNEQGSLVLILDRVSSESINEKGLLDSLQQAFQISRGSCFIIHLSKTKEILAEQGYSTLYQDPASPELVIPAAQPGLFDPNSPIGACQNCRGFGMSLVIDEDKVFREPAKSLTQGVIDCWNGPKAKGLLSKMIKFAEANDINPDLPWRDLPRAKQETILHHRGREYRGVFPWFETLERKAYKMHVRVFLARYRSQVPCNVCDGARLKSEALYFRLCNKNIKEVAATPIDQLHHWIGLIRELTDNKLDSLQLIETVDRFDSRIKYLLDLGLPYLSLGRQSRTLSGGETQRVNLATALGSGLVSTQFVLDEPSVGLHPRDTERLIDSVTQLASRGNSVLMVEHDLDCITCADQILEIGPKSGVQGGQLTFQGSPAKWNAPRPVEVIKRKPRKGHEVLEIKNATKRNLKGISLTIPLNTFTVISGVSGSGKSTLVSEVLLDAYQRFSSDSAQLDSDSVYGFEQVSQVLHIDQSGLAKSPRANIATYSGIWDFVRKALADSDDARARSLTASSFSFNVDGGRCPNCKGTGQLKEDMQFLSDVYVTCDLCLGKRFQPKVLEVEFEGRNAYQWLQTTAEECARLLHTKPKVARSAEVLCQLGLGYLRLGHSLSDLSGGEAQRLKLVPFIQRGDSGNSLLLFDEPTTGLHLHDTENLIALFHELIQLGHSIICIEHNQEILRHADWIIDLGPEGGEAGGYITLQGAPEAFLLKKNKKISATARYLQEYIERFVKSSTPFQSPTKAKSKRNSKSQTLSIHGAREHNLKNISLEIPHNQLVAITGISGSGKSTIAKDIIFAEGQRRYLDCLSPYARQFIRELSKPEVDEVQNVRPTICVYQHTFQPSKLSTLGTMSEVYNFLRLLFVKLGDQFCPDHPDQQVTVLAPEEIVDQLVALKESEVRLLAPIIKGKKGLHRAVFERAIRADMREVRVDGRYAKPNAFDEGLERNKPHDIDFVWAKVVPSRVPRALLVDAVEEVFALGGGTFMAAWGDHERVFSRERSCPKCRKGVFQLDPEDLSFHSRRGKCEGCNGSGLSDDSGKVCPKCNGTRLNKKALSVKIRSVDIATLCDRTATEIKDFLEGIVWSKNQISLAEPIMQEIRHRLTTLEELGLDYLPLARSCQNLSSGELQRLRIASAMGTSLSGAMYIFDEPSAGLHPFDNSQVLKKLREMQLQDNSILIIEHDRESISQCDYVVEVGPGAGSKGGEITYSGPTSKFPGLSEAAFEQSILPGSSEFLRVKAKLQNNIRAIELKLPLKQFVVLAGVSGSGKSTLLHQIIETTIAKNKDKKARSFSSTNIEIESDLEIERLLVVDQKPIGKNSRSTPASYLKVWDEVRKLFALTVEARSRGWTAGFFSYNSGKGRCQECKGLGRIKLEMSFMAEASVTCAHCNGSRYSDEALTIKYGGYTIAEVLQMTFEQALELFAQHKKLHRALHQTCELGLGYLCLGQSSTTLSGGESQRIKLAAELSSRPRGHTVYLLDEPSIGLHPQDVSRLLKMLRSLVAPGNSVFVIEHDHDLIRHADYLVEMGPGAGPDGGEVIFSGNPKKLASSKQSKWATILA